MEKRKMSNSWQNHRRAFLRVIPVITLLMTSLCFAHQQKVALTDILYNERTGNLEIAHRISLHDAEHALHELTESRADLTKSPEAQAAFAKYVAQRFELTSKDKTNLKLTLVGQEIERGYLWIYQETKIPKPTDPSFFITNTFLQEIIKGQVNTVNIRKGAQVATLTFKAKSGRQHYAGPNDLKPTPKNPGEEVEEAKEPEK